MRLKFGTQTLFYALLVAAFTTLSTLVGEAEAGNTGFDYYLDGIGYREQALQQPKTSFFKSEKPEGVLYASFNGGTNIFIKGPNLADNPASNVIWFESVELDGVNIPAPTLNEDDAFNSNPLLGFITYRIPSVHELFAAPAAAFDTNDYLHFYISIKAPDVFGEEQHMTCKVQENCKIRFLKSYTPVVFYLSPPVIYYESFTEVWFDPKSTQHVIRDLQADEMRFVNTEIGGSKLDFEGIVDHLTAFSYWHDNRVKGQVGEMPVGHNKDIKMLWEVGYAMVSETEALHCSYDNQTCYQAMNVPVIFNLSSHTGYTSGSQNLTIHGHGFNSENITVTVDGVNCTVTEYQEESISCEVKPKTEPSLYNVPQVGSNGIRRKFWNYTNINWDRMDSWGNTNEYLATQFEVPTNDWYRIGNKMFTWFVAPETTNYRFRMACDDLCDLKIGLDPSDPLNTTLVASRRAGTGHRYHMRLIGDTVSEWYPLTKGQKYYMYGKHLEYHGSDHFVVGVEVEQTAMVDHHHAMKEIQYIEATVENATYDTMRVTVDDPTASGKYYLTFQIPKNLSYWTSKAITPGASASELKEAIKFYYSNVYGSDIAVNLTMFDTNGTNTTNATEATQYVYHIRCRKLISTASVSNVLIAKQTSAAVTVDQPAAVSMSSAPLSGRFRITCPIENNDVVAEPLATDDIKLDEYYRWIMNSVFKKCPNTYDKLEIWDSGKFPYRQNGLGFYVRFVGSNGPKTQMRIVSGVDTPLEGTNITYYQNKTVPASTNLFFEAIPFEMLRTYETEPQVLVTVGEYPAVCHNLTCNFHYTVPEGEVTAFTYTEGTKQLQITGTNLPNTTALIRHVEFGHSLCTIDVSTVSDTGLTCTLDHEPVCGDHLPQYVSKQGLVNNSATLNPTTITCTVSSVDPTTMLNLLGGDNLTISGTQFPWNLARSVVELKFNDAQETKCVPQESTSTTLVCLTSAFDKTVAAGQTLQMSININGQQVTNALSLTTMATTKAGILVNPSSANPTLKTKINITLEPDFPYTMDKSHFTVNATNISNPTYFRQMNVIAVDDSTKTLTCMFGGAWSGLYQLNIRHRQFGLVETVGITLTVGSNVTAVSPQAGSIYGGTLITITGTNFGKEFTDNPVQISTLGAVGSVDCYLQSIQETEIKCRLDKTNKTDGLSGKVIVFLKTSEEAVCQPDNAPCQWNYMSNIPEVTNMETAWDATNLYWTVVVTGTGFTGTPQTTELNVAGRAQTTLSVTSTQAVFRVSDISGWTLSNMNVYFDVGLPKGYNTVIQTKTFTLEPKLISVTPNSGSIGGTALTARVEGLGPLSNKTEAYWNAHGGTLVDSSNNTDICASVKIRSYGEVECITLPGVINASTVVGAKSFESNSYVACENTDASLCTYEQLEGATFPVVSSISDAVPGQIIFTGTNFFTTGYTGGASYGGINADTVVIDSATQVTATWDLGFPPLGQAVAPSLWFDETTSNTTHYASISANLTKPLTVTAGYNGLSCSFAGGCNLQLNAEGLSTILKNDSSQNYITVCEEKCHFVRNLSDSSKAVCQMPKMSTIYSNENFKIETQKEDLRFRKIFGNLDDVSEVFDNKLLQMPTIQSSESTCYFGGSFKANHVGMLSQVKYFMGEIEDKTIFVGVLTFQGSPDNSTWYDLFSADENVHEGWNYHKWETSADYPTYRFYRFFSNNNAGCLMGEIKMTGVETVADTGSSYSCPVAVEMNDQVVTSLTEQVLYLGTKTPLLTSIEPRYGTVTGGTSVTFTGTGFSTDTSLYQVVIDKRNCTVTAATTTSVTCTTDHRPGLVSPSLEIYVDGMGLVSNQEKLFRYVSMWSDDTTWGGEFAPMYMESIYVPEGLNLYIDVDRTPELNLIMVEGSLIFAPEADPNHERYFDARYIFLHKGYMEVGTEEHPYTSKLTITMHGNISSPYLPIFGNKCIAVKESTLDMHGLKREPTWTLLNETVLPGATQIKITGPVDWVAGEEIAIATTSFNPREGEKRMIKAIDKTNPDIPVVTLDYPLEYKHFAMIQWYGDDFIDMRAEIGLLTRNVKYRGDPETSLQNQYGATIFLHSEGDDSLVARLEYIELTDVGQAFKIGRYAVHFHMIGAVHKSYCKGFGTHQSFNRAFTLHGTHYMRLINNVGYNIKGHVIFIEDAVEKKNLIHNNCIIMAKRSWSLLNTDQTPACFWITNPDNNFVDNHCGGSDRYGYWYDLQIHAIGPHASTDVCPENERVGEFRGNHAHSCGRYGFRIFHNMIPRKYPCKPITYDINNQSDPFHQNPAITAHFYGLTSWKNGRNGAIAGKIGDVRFHDFKLADNRLAGIEVGVCDDHGDNTTLIDNALIIGRTNNTELILDEAQPFGIIGSRTDNLRIENCRFFNFDWSETAALSTCSHCWHDQETDSGARTTRLKNMTFDSSVKRLINWGYPYKGIFLDEDGSITGKGPRSWATPYKKHHEYPECEHNISYWGGTFCDNTVQIRRVAFHNAQPASIFSMMGLKVLRMDDHVLAEHDNITEYKMNKSNYATINFKEKQDPGMGWATPFITGKKYKIHFGQTGLDYEKLQFDLSEKWEETDDPIYLIHNWTDVRMAIDFTVKEKDSNNYYTVPNNSIASDKSQWQLGQNVVYNETAVRETHFIVSPKNQSIDPYQEQTVKMEGHRCVGPCGEQLNESVPDENRTRYWNNSEDWPNGTVPAEGEDVHIEPGWNMVFNMNPSPIYTLIRVNGKLTFENTTDTHLRCKHLFIRAGELHVGSAEYPMLQNARITLYGEKQMETIVYDNAIEAGNKLIANVNVLRMFGKPRSWKMTRLHAPVLKGENEFYVEPGLDIVAGDRLGLLPTSFAPYTVDDVFVTSYDITSGKVVASHAMNYYHWGQATSTAPNYNGVDIRGEVLLLTRNVKIDAEDIESWGGQIVTSDTVEVYDGVMTMRSGTTIMDNVEIFNCSQIDTEKSAIRFQSAASNWSSITNSALHNGYAWAMNIATSANILIKNNVMFQFRPMGLATQMSKNITIDDNVVAGIVERTTLDFDGGMMVDKGGGYSICALIEGDPCTDVRVRNNIAAGTVYAGFVTVGHECGNYDMMGGNIAHSIKGLYAGHGAYIKQSSVQSTCTEYSYFTGYKCYYQGAFAYPDEVQIKLTQMTLIDNRQGFGAQVMRAEGPGEYEVENEHIVFNDIFVYGESESPDCPQDGNGGFCHKYHKMAFFASFATWGGKGMHITHTSPMPPHNVMSIASWWVNVVLNRVKFINFKATTREGMDQRAFQMNPWASDNIPVQKFYDTEFINCEDDAIAFFMEPPQKWAIIKDCGNFPCTAPKNTYFTFERNRFSGIRPAYAAENFQLIPDTPGFSELIPNCEKQEKMNLWTCQQDKFGMIMFESEDEDTLDRSVQPIYSRLQGTDMNNKVNSMMDHVWDGFYTGQTRLSRFPVIVYAPRGAVYDIIYTGTPPKKQKYQLFSQDNSLEMIVRIAYPGAESRQILKDGNRVEMNAWDEKTQQYGEVKRRFCGENRFIGVKNILEFYLTKGCVLQIAPRDAIQTMVRMEWTMNEFFSNGGTTKFIDRVAGSLGIHASTIKVVSVYEGSVVLNYDIVVDSTNTNAAQSALKKIKAKQTEKFATGAMDLGAPILDVQASTVSSAPASKQASSQQKVEKIISGGVVTAPGYDPIVITASASTSNEPQGGVFVPDIPIMQVDTINIVYDNQTVDKTNYVNQIDNNKKIVQVGDKQITIIENADDTSMMIIVIGSSSVILLCLGILARFLWNRIREQKARAEQIKNTQTNLNRGKITVLPKRGEFNARAVTDANLMKQNDDNSPQDPINPGDDSGEIYEEQYDPNQEFRIFGIGDKTKGGVQSLQQKMNMADDVNSDGSSDSEEEDQADKKEKDEVNDAHLAVPNPQSKSDVSLHSSSQSLHEKQGLIQQSTPMGSITNYSETKNVLPEDQEIIDEEEEEEV